MQKARSTIGKRPSTEHLLSAQDQTTELRDMNGSDDRRGEPLEVSDAKNPTHIEHPYSDAPSSSGLTESSRQTTLENDITAQEPVNYKIYKRRWFGLMQLVLLNIIVSWDWLSYSPVANTTATFFNTTPSIINWLSTAFLFAFVVASPATLYTLHSSGPRLAIITASILILLGNWIRYGGTRASTPSFGLTMFGQILIGLAQPFVLTAPTRYSDLWFSPRGRVSATAIMSLANPFGGALGQLINPFLAVNPSDIPNMTLYIAVISSVATIPSFFIPARPPTPVSASHTHPHQSSTSFISQLRLLSCSSNFWLILLPFSVYVGLFNSLSSLLTQILTPYNYSETESGISGALLILVGLIAAAITSPIVDRSKRYLFLIKTIVPILAICYLVFIWVPNPSANVAGPYIVSSILGAASFSLVPVALEWVVEITYPVGPEFSSVLCWAGGQILGGIFIVISDVLKAGAEARPPFNMSRALIFQAVVACAVVPCALALGTNWVGRVENKRLEIDKGREEIGVEHVSS